MLKKYFSSWDLIRNKNNNEENKQINKGLVNKCTQGIS